MVSRKASACLETVLDHAQRLSWIPPWNHWPLFVQHSLPSVAWLSLNGLGSGSVDDCAVIVVSCDATKKSHKAGFLRSELSFFYCLVQTKDRANKQGPTPIFLIESADGFWRHSTYSYIEDIAL